MTLRSFYRVCSNYVNILRFRYCTFFCGFMPIIDVTITKHKKLWKFSWCKMSKGKHCSSDKHSIWSREPVSEQIIHSLTINVRSSHLKCPTSEDDFFFERTTRHIVHAYLPHSQGYHKKSSKHSFLQNGCQNPSDAQQTGSAAIKEKVLNNQVVYLAWPDMQ